MVETPELSRDERLARLRAAHPAYLRGRAEARKRHLDALLAEFADDDTERELTDVIDFDNEVTE